jgi:predicted regulator of Ras-like GTPase activity (Roadblock/LC7/MglB family)
VTIPAHKDPRLIALGADVLDEMNDICKSLVYGAFLTDDGFEVVGFPAARGDGSRMASMASSMQALGDAVAREMHLGTSEYIIVAAPKGYVIQLRVPGGDLVLSTMFGDSETLGKALSISRMSARKMSALMDPGTP